MSKQHSAKVMFDQSVVYLFNSYIEEGNSMEEASRLVAKDIEEVHAKHQERGIVPPTSILKNPVTKLNKALNTIDTDVNPLGLTPSQILNRYVDLLKSVKTDITHAKHMLEK